MGSREGSTMYTRMCDTVRGVWRFTCKPVRGFGLSTSLLASVSTPALHGVGYRNNGWDTDIGVSDKTVTRFEQIVYGYKSSHWLSNIMRGKENGFKMSDSRGSSAVFNTCNFDENTSLPAECIKEIDHKQSGGVKYSTNFQPESDSCTSSGVSLGTTFQGLVQHCQTWPLNSLYSLAKTLMCPDWPTLSSQFALWSDCRVFGETSLSSALSNKVLLYFGVQYTQLAMDKSQCIDLCHKSRNSRELCVNNSNNTVPGSEGNASIDADRKKSCSPIAGSETTVMVDYRCDSSCIQRSKSFRPHKCDMNNAVGNDPDHMSNCNHLSHGCTSVKLGKDKQSEPINGKVCALSQLCGSCKVTSTQGSVIAVISRRCVSQPHLSEGKKNKKARPSAKKRRRLRLKRDSEEHTCSGIAGSHTTCNQRSRENINFTMTIDQHPQCDVDTFTVVMSECVLSPDTSSESDSDSDDEADGGFVDMDAAAALWDSFTSGDPYNPLSFQFACTISSSATTPGGTTIFADVEFGASPVSPRIHDANRKWNESYQETNFDECDGVDSGEDRKVRVDKL